MESTELFPKIGRSLTFGCSMVGTGLNWPTISRDKEETQTRGSACIDTPSPHAPTILFASGEDNNIDFRFSVQIRLLFHLSALVRSQLVNEVLGLCSSFPNAEELAYLSVSHNKRYRIQYE